MKWSSKSEPANKSTFWFIEGVSDCRRSQLERQFIEFIQWMERIGAAARAATQKKFKFLLMEAALAQLNSLLLSLNKLKKFSFWAEKKELSEIAEKLKIL